MSKVGIFRLAHTCHNRVETVSEDENWRGIQLFSDCVDDLSSKSDWSRALPNRDVETCDVILGCFVDKFPDIFAALGLGGSRLKKIIICEFSTGRGSDTESFRIFSLRGDLYHEKLNGTNDEDHVPKLLMSVGQFLSNFNDLRKLDLRGLNLDCADLSNSNLGSSNLTGASLKRANLRNAKLVGAILDSANLERADLSFSDLSCVSLKKAILCAATLDFAKLRYTQLISADLRFASIAKADLTGANLVRANLTESNLIESILDKANFTDAILLRAKLADAIFGETKLIRTDLTFAYLESARFYETDLSCANLSYANLEKAVLTSVILIGANLTGAKFAGTSITIGMCEKSTRILLNGCLSYSDGNVSLLTAIRSIDNKFAELKRNLVLQVLEFLYTSYDDLTDASTALTSFFANTDIYDGEEYIDAFRKYDLRGIQ